MTTLPPVALTCGDPSGVGPELAVKAREALGASVPFFWIGDPRHLPANTLWQPIARPEEAQGIAPDTLPVLPHDFPATATPGTPEARNAGAVIEVIARAVELVRSGAAAAVTTAPINKQVLVEGAGFAYPGHTEYLAALAGGADVVMMLASDALRVVPATIHIALADVPSRLTPDLLEQVITTTRAALISDFGIPQPRIAVAGLNPHAGEGGIMGGEELAFIAPLLERLRAEGFDLKGPLPADTMFHARARQGYDAAVAMYHDQALIPIKTIDFDAGVNVTLGLPFVRTSPDHGTAFDIAGQGIATPTSLINAIGLAHDMAARRRSGGRA